MTTAESTVDLAELESDPYPVYARLRRHQPVAWVPALGVWIVTRWPDVRRVLSSPQSFVTTYASPAARICGEQTMLATEGDRHAELRAGLDDCFSPEMIPGIVEATRKVATDHAVALSGRDGAELMTEYFKPVVATVLGRFLGLGDVDPATLCRWSEHLLDGFDNPTRDQRLRAQTAAREVAEAVRVLAERAGTHPDDTPLSHLVHADAQRAPVDVVPTFVNLVSAVVEPAIAAGSTLLALLNRPAQLRLVLTDPARTRDAVREGLRFCPPIGTLGRVTTRPVTLNGQDLPGGAVVAAAVASANRDPAVYRDADRFDIDRPAQPNTGLGYGRHRCLAAAVVPAVVTTTLRTLLAHIGTPGLVDDRPVRPHGWKVRKLDALPVRWDPPAATGRR